MDCACGCRRACRPARRSRSSPPCRASRASNATPCSIPNDPLYHLQHDARLVSPERAWDLTTGSSNVIEAVCDSGIASGPVELQGKLVAGTVTTPFSTTTEDVFGHGTAMASIIAARRNNGVVASGLAPGCRVMPVEVSSDQGLYTNFEVSAGSSEPPMRARARS